MTRKPRDHAGSLLLWLGRRSGREIRLLWIVFAVLLVYVLGSHLVWGSVQDWKRERVRLRASQVSIQNLEQLLMRRDEIMTRAEVLVDDYLQSQKLEASTLLLQRIDRARSPKIGLLSVYPLSTGSDRRGARFRVNLSGPAGALGRLFFTLGEGAPPIVLKELALTAERGARDHLLATAVLEVEEKALPAEWVRLFAHWDVPGTDAGPDTADVRRRRAVGQDRQRARKSTTTPYPYKALDRVGVFRTASQGEPTSRLGAAAPTIQGLLQDLSLLGVIWGENPVAIITQKSGAQTHYREVGQFIGELEIVEIQRGSVTLRYKEEEGRLE